MITVRKCRVSSAWHYHRKTGVPTRPIEFSTVWVVTDNGKRVDSFLSKGQAEKKAATLRRASALAQEPAP